MQKKQEMFMKKTAALLSLIFLSAVGLSLNLIRVNANGSYNQNKLDSIYFLDLGKNKVHSNGNTSSGGSFTKITFMYDYYICMPDKSEPKTYLQAIDYCNSLSEKEGLPCAYDENFQLVDAAGLPTTDLSNVFGYRLATQAELANAIFMDYGKDDSIPLKDIESIYNFFAKSPSPTNFYDPGFILDMNFGNISSNIFEHMVNPILGYKAPSVVPSSYINHLSYIDPHFCCCYVNGSSKELRFSTGAGFSFFEKIFFVVRTIPGKNPPFFKEYLDGKVNDLSTCAIRNINERYRNGSTLLIEAVKKEDIKNIKFLLSKNADSSCWDYLPKNAAIYAIESGNLDILKLLIENGADINYERMVIDGVFETAYKTKKTDIMRYLMNIDCEELYGYPDYLYTFSYLMKHETWDLFLEVLDHKNDFIDLEYSFLKAYPQPEQYSDYTVLDSLIKKIPGFSFNKVLGDFYYPYFLKSADLRSTSRLIKYDGSLAFLIGIWESESIVDTAKHLYVSDTLQKDAINLFSYLQEKGVDLNQVYSTSKNADAIPLIWKACLTEKYLWNGFYLRSLLEMGVDPNALFRGSSLYEREDFLNDSIRKYIEPYNKNQKWINEELSMVLLKKGDLSIRNTSEYRIKMNYDFLITKDAFDYDHDDLSYIFEPCGIKNYSSKSYYTKYKDICNALSDLKGIPRAYGSDYRFIDSSGNPVDDPSKVVGYRLPTEAEYEYALYTLLGNPIDKNKLGNFIAGSFVTPVEDSYTENYYQNFQKEKYFSCSAATEQTYTDKNGFVLRYETYSDYTFSFTVKRKSSKSKQSDSDEDRYIDLGRFFRIVRTVPDSD